VLLTLGLNKVATGDTLLNSVVENIVKIAGIDLKVALDVLLQGLTAKNELAIDTKEKEKV
jgi:hypothetical protein